MYFSMVKKLQLLKKNLMKLLTLLGFQTGVNILRVNFQEVNSSVLQIARALINNPEVILADEPIGNLDSKTGTEIMELLQKINLEKKKTIIMVTHSKKSAEYSTRTILVQDGKII